VKVPGNPLQDVSAPFHDEQNLLCHVHKYRYTEALKNDSTMGVDLSNQNKNLNNKTLTDLTQMSGTSSIHVKLLHVTRVTQHKLI